MTTMITPYGQALAVLNTLPNSPLRDLAVASLDLRTAMADPGTPQENFEKYGQTIATPSLWAQPGVGSALPGKKPSTTETLSASPDSHSFVSGAKTESFIYKHLSAHLDDKPSLASKVNAEKFGGALPLINFAEGWLQKAYRGELAPGSELDIEIPREGQKPLKGKLRLMKTGEMVDGAPVGESGPGKLSIIRVTFDQPVGENSVVALDDLPAGTPTLTVDRVMGNRQDRVHVARGKHQLSKQLMIIGGPYSEDSYGLYTVYAGRYTMGYDPKDPESMAYWDRHAYLTGDKEKLVEPRGKGDVINPDSKLFEMIRNGDVTVPRGTLSRVRRAEVITGGRSLVEGGEGVVIYAIPSDRPVEEKPKNHRADFAGAKVNGLHEDVEVSFKLQDSGKEETYQIPFISAISLGFIEYDGVKASPVAPEDAPIGNIVIEK
jgi:hypothetical protein